MEPRHVRHIAQPVRGDFGAILVLRCAAPALRVGAAPFHNADNGVDGGLHMIERKRRLATRLERAALGVGPLDAVIVVLPDLCVPARAVQHIHGDRGFALQVGKIGVRFFLVISHYAVFQFCCAAKDRVRA